MAAYEMTANLVLGLERALRCPIWFDIYVFWFSLCPCMCIHIHFICIVLDSSLSLLRNAVYTPCLHAFCKFVQEHFCIRYFNHCLYLFLQRLFLRVFCFLFCDAVFLSFFLCYVCVFLVLWCSVCCHAFCFGLLCIWFWFHAKKLTWLHTGFASNVQSRLMECVLCARKVAGSIPWRNHQKHAHAHMWFAFQEATIIPSFDTIG